MKKNAIKKILVPIDFSVTSEIAMEESIKLAHLLNADIFLIHVIEFIGYYYSVVPETKTMLPPFQDIEKSIKKKMNETQKKIKKNFGIISKTHISTGHVHAEIINFSIKEKIDLIIMGTHGILGYKEFFIGSNAQRVITLSNIPVLTIQKESSEFKNILIPIDNSLHSREKVNMAMTFANLFDATIHLIGLPDSTDKQELKAIKIKLKSVEKIIRANKLSYITTIVYGDSLSENAMKYASENNCDLIVINTGHESEITGIFLGAFAQQIVNHSKIPVLSIKPTEGYFSIDTQGYGIW